jgi:hypothetical protein
MPYYTGLDVAAKLEPSSRNRHPVELPELIDTATAKRFI